MQIIPMSSIIWSLTPLWVCLRHVSLDITYDIARKSVNRINKTHRPFRQTVLFSRRGDYFDRATRGSRRLFRSFRENASLRFAIYPQPQHRQNKTRVGYVTDIGRVRGGVARWFSFLERTSRTVLFASRDRVSMNPSHELPTPSVCKIVFPSPPPQRRYINLQLLLFRLPSPLPDLRKGSLYSDSCIGSIY